MRIIITKDHVTRELASPFIVEIERESLAYLVQRLTTVLSEAGNEGSITFHVDDRGRRERPEVRRWVDKPTQEWAK